jgi:hypothetical protein
LSTLSTKVSVILVYQVLLPCIGVPATVSSKDLSIGRVEFRSQQIVGGNHLHCNENPTYVFLFWEQRSLSPNIPFLGIFVSKFWYFVFAVWQLEQEFSLLARKPWSRLRSIGEL